MKLRQLIKKALQAFPNATMEWQMVSTTNGRVQCQFYGNKQDVINSIMRNRNHRIGIEDGKSILIPLDYEVEITEAADAVDNNPFERAKHSWKKDKVDKSKERYNQRLNTRR